MYLFHERDICTFFMSEMSVPFFMSEMSVPFSWTSATHCFRVLFEPVCSRTLHFNRSCVLRLTYKLPSATYLSLHGVSTGSVLQYSIFLCTRLNSALTTSVVGCVKNLLPTVVGMMGLGGDYEFEVLNCIGLTVSMGGSFLYSWAKATKR